MSSIDKKHEPIVFHGKYIVTSDLPDRAPDYKCMFSGTHRNKVFCQFWFAEMICQWPIPFGAGIKAADLVVENGLLCYKTGFKEESLIPFARVIQEAFQSYVDGILL